MIVKVEANNDIFFENKLIEIFEASEEDYKTDKEIILKEWKQKCFHANSTSEMIEFFKETLENNGIVYRDIEEDVVETVSATA